MDPNNTSASGLNSLGNRIPPSGKLLLAKESDSNLRKHAAAELERAGFFEAGVVYEPGTLGGDILDLITLLASQGHSGGSIGIVRQTFHLLSDFKPLSPITNDPAEWNGPDTPGAPTFGSPGLWQNKRNSSAFSKDSGITHWTLEGGRDNITITTEAKK